MKKKTRKPKRQGVMVVKYDWAFRWLRNQAIQFFTRGNSEHRSVLRRALVGCKTYSDMEKETRSFEQGNGDGKTWGQFMDHLFRSTVKKRMKA